MHVRTETLDDEIAVTVDAALEMANLIAAPSDDDPDELAAAVRRTLVDHEFVRARSASADELAALVDRMTAIGRLLGQLPDLELADAVRRLNVELESSAIAPSLSAHDGFALHIHWTSPTTPFAHQVAVDVLMAVAQTLCDHGVERFGRCAAEGCERLFYDTTKNRSRRFCADQRCASRTHTAAHRARQAASA